MINDLLQTEDGRIGKYNGEFRRYISCDSDYYRICLMSIRSDTDGLYLPEARVNPIPLTGEILEDNGFAYEKAECSDIECFRLKCDSDGFIEINNFDGLYFYAMLTWKETKLEYVHQLQHLLRLCGLDELADNLKI